MPSILMIIMTGRHCNSQLVEVLTSSLTSISHQWARQGVIMKDQLLPKLTYSTCFQQMPQLLLLTKIIYWMISSRKELNL